MVAALFPGQGSQKPGMGQSLFDAHAEARAVFSTVSETTGIDVANLCFAADAETLTLTQNAQIALYTCGVAAYHCFAATGRSANLFAGHSIGEYAAIVCSGALSIEDGARLVQKRGELMSQAKSGAMAAVIGLERGPVEQVLSLITGIVVIANDNCPGQFVISGETDAVELAMPALKEAGAKIVTKLNVSGAFHSPLMVDASVSMREALDKASFTVGLPVYSNVTAGRVENPAMFPELLEKQLCGSVNWTPQMLKMIDEGMTSAFEIGSGKVLAGLMKRIDKEIPVTVVEDTEGLI
ncbi:MAG TPA: ACP S-malonyltransferase [Fimbriimonas sp.]|nr:ACP S-malonyltransferase [Fimbriimonas sp.]